MKIVADIINYCETTQGAAHHLYKFAILAWSLTKSQAGIAIIGTAAGWLLKKKHIEIKLVRRLEENTKEGTKVDDLLDTIINEYDKE